MVGQLALVVTGTLAARLLGPSARGELASFVLVPTLLATTTTLGVPNAAIYFLASRRDATNDIVAKLLCLAGLQISVATLLHAAWLTTRHVASPTTSALLIGAVPSLVIQQYGAAVLQGLGDSRRFNLGRTLPALTYALMIPAVSMVRRIQSADQFATVWVITTMAAAIITAAMARHAIARTPRHPKTVRYRELIAIAIRGALGPTSLLENLRLDQAAVMTYLPTHVMGLYAAAAAFVNLPKFVGQSVGFVAYPDIAAIVPAQQRVKRAIRYALLNAALVCAVGSLISLFSPLVVPLLFGSSFRESVGLTQRLAIAGTLIGIRRGLGDVLRGLGRPMPDTFAELVALACMVGTIELAVPLYGLGGVIAANIVSSGAAVILLVVVLLSIVRIGKEHESPEINAAF